MNPPKPATASLTLPRPRRSSFEVKWPVLVAVFCLAVAPRELQALPISVSGDVIPSTPVNPVWDLGIGLIIGDTGTGNMTIAPGGTVLNTQAILGWNFSASGTVNLTGGNWINTMNLTVGNLGTGTINLFSGNLTSNGTSVGWASPATGTVNASGGNWENVGTFFVGDTGAGTLNLSGGEITTDSVVVARFGGSTGVLNLTGGVLTTGQIAYGDGNGTISFDGGTLRISADQSNLFAGSSASVAVVGSGGTIDTQGFDVQTFANLTGNGSLTKSGAGTLTLAASKTNNGTLTVSEGTLRFTNLGNVSGDITNHGSVVWTRFDDTFFVQTISGNGSFTQEAGILRLTQAQTYTGPTKIDGGFLVLPTGVDGSRQLLSCHLGRRCLPRSLHANPEHATRRCRNHLQL